MKVNKAKYRLIAAIMLSFFVGTALGVLVQKYHLPGIILQKCLYTYTTYFQADDDTGEIITTGDITVRTRAFKPAADPEKFDTERDSVYTYDQRSLDIHRTALIVIDAWAYSANDGYLKRTEENMRLKLSPLLQLARKHNMVVIHAPHGQEIAEIAKPLPGELVVHSSTAELDAYLKAHHITTLLYAGYASNMCVLLRPTGIIKMRELGYNIILVRDCTIAVEMPESLDGQWANKIAVNMIETQWGETTTLEDLEAAFKEHN